MIFFPLAEATSLPRVLRRSRMFPAIRNKALLLATLIAVACISAAPARGQGLQPDEQPSSIRGTVINSVTHAPIARALVYTPDNRFAMLTDGEGHFEFPLPQADTGSGTGIEVFGEPQQPRLYERAGHQFWLLARKPGFLDDPNDRTEASPGTDVTVSLMPEALIKGRVALSTADAAVGVTVQIFSRQVQEGFPRWLLGTSVRANSSGEFRFADLPSGAYKLMTHELRDNDPVASVPGGQLYGFPPVYYPGVPDFAAAGTIELAAGQSVDVDLSLTRQPYFDVKIPVANGETNGGMNVSVQGQRGPGYSLGYNPGEQRIEGMLPNGNYVVEIVTYGQIPATGMVSLRVAGAPVEGPSMTLTRNSSIRLNVKEEFSDLNQNISGTWADGKRTWALHGPRLYLQARVEPVDDGEQNRGGSPRPPTGPNDDSLVLENLAPGRYWLRLNSSRGYVASATMGAVDLLHEPLVVGPGADTPIEIKMRDDTAEIDGTVTTIAATRPASGETTEPSSPQAWVYCVPLPDSLGQFQQLAVSADGKFLSPSMAPGSYQVLAFAKRQPNLPYRDAEAMRAYDTKGPVIHLAAGQKAAVQVQLISSSE